MKLGVAITTRNRRALFNRSLSHWRRLMPRDGVLVVVDDASTDPVPDLDGVVIIRHDERLGVAVSKNDGITALMDMGCDELFLADDDLHPTSIRWWEPYVESPESHLSYQGPRSRASVSDGGDDAHYAVEFPRGFMLYVRRDVIDAVGGMDPAYGMWGGEHAEWQRRIHDAGLTTWAYADVRSSDRLWNTYASGSTVGYQERKQMLAATDLFWQKASPRFVPYRAGHHEQDWSLLPSIKGTRWPLLRHVLDLQPQGVAVEFGVGEGNTTRLIAERMSVTGFDSGLGLPEYWRPGYAKGCFAVGVPDIPGAHMVPGWFEDTVPTFDFAALGYVGLWHIDCDLYSSTKVVLDTIGPHLRRGAFIVFDEMWDYEGYEEHEYKAWTEFAEESKIGWTVVGYGPEQPWAIRIG